MFKSKLRPITIPQAEHGKLAGTLALLWGNAQFDRPALDFSSFVLGIGLHDRGYQTLDNFPLLETPDTAWLQITRQGFYMPMSDPSADLIVKLHLKRLTSYDKTPARQALLAEMEHAIQQQVEQHQLNREEFQRIDRITNFCDSLAFDFCFEKPTQKTIKIFPKNGSNEELPLRYTIDAGVITVDPWPFSVESHHGYLVGYQMAAYPTVLDPVIVPYQIERLHS
ncbi:MAG: DUF3891 family protein [Caldilineaceae bacterium]